MKQRERSPLVLFEIYIQPQSISIIPTRDSVMFAIITVLKEGKNEGVKCHSVWTGAQAEKKIKERFLLEGGGLEDVANGLIVGDDEQLGIRQLRFVGGRRTGDYLSFNPACQFK